MIQQQEKIGTFLLLASAAMWGIFPVLVNKGAQNVPPIHFAALTTLLAAVGAFFYAFATGKISELRNKEAYASLLMITLCIVVVPYILFFFGASKTSGLNTSMLLLTEIIFTLIFTHFIGEKTTFEKLLGSLAILFGAAVLLYRGRWEFNIGDLLIIASVALYPIGNFYAKKALHFVSPAIILFVRFLLGGIFIFAFSALAEPRADTAEIIRNNWPLIAFIGFILLGAGKIIYYEGLKRLDISKAISLAMTFPLFSLLILVGIFKEKLIAIQWAGILIMAIGIYFSVKRASVDPLDTKYSPCPRV